MDWLYDRMRGTYIGYRIVFILCNTSLKTEVECSTDDHDSLGSFLFKGFDHKLVFKKVPFLKLQGLKKSWNVLVSQPSS